MLPYKRSERVAELLRERACRALLEIGVPDTAGLITITGVTITDDLSEARVYYSVLGSEEQKKAAQEFFRKTSGELKYFIGEGLSMKKVPSMNFIYDETPERAARIFNILEEIKAPRASSETIRKVNKRSAPKRKSKSAGR